MRNLIIMLALSSAAWAGTVTLTGTFNDPQGNPLNGTLSMQLPVPATDTVNSIAVSPTPVYYTVTNGIVQPGPLLEDVANLQPRGLWYRMRLFDTAGNLVTYGNYIVTGTPYNIGNAVPTTVTTSNVSYLNPAALNANNVWTGSNTFNGPVTFNQPISASINGTFSAFTATGVDMCAKINATIIAHPASIVDARQFTGIQPCASNPFVGATGDVVLLLGETVTIQTTAPWVTPSSFDALIYGSGRGSSGRGTTIQAVAGFPATCAGLASGCPILRLGDGTGPAFGHRFENGTIDCNGIAGCIGMYSSDIQEQSGMYHFSILNFPVFGILIDGSSAAGAGPFYSQNYELFDGEVYALTFGTGTTVAVKIIAGNNAAGGETAPRLIEHVTASGASGHNILAAFQFEQFWGGELLGLNAEFSTTGFQFGITKPMNGTTASNLRCANVVTNCVWITSNSPFSNNVVLTGIQNTPTVATQTIKDDMQGLNITDVTVGLHIVGNGYSGGGFTSLSTSTQSLGLTTVQITDKNGKDAANTFALDSGATASQGQIIQFSDRGTNKWALQNTSGNLFQIFDNANNITRFRASGTQTFLNTTGTGALFINNDASSGTGGFTVCNGGATCNFTVGGAGATTINAPVTVTSSINGSDTTLVCTMAAGVCSANLSHTYNAAPACVSSWTGSGTLTGLIKVSSSTTQATATSTVGTDTAQVHFACFGT